MFSIGLTDHLEGPPDASARVFAEVTDLVGLADALGVRYAWFAEHHAHAHFGHCPTPLLYALHLAGRTTNIQLGTAICCLNLHHPLDIAEQIAVADLLAGGRLAPGFGSGSTPEEFALFGMPETNEQERHARFAEALTVIRAAWRPDGITQSSPHFPIPPHRPLPAPAADLFSRCWAAVNSAGAAKIAGQFNLNVLFSHLRTPEQYREYSAVYRAAGGTRKIAANRPVYVGEDDASAFPECETALRTLWRRFQREGKIPASAREPANPAELCGHPINFVVGGPQSVAQQLRDLHDQCAFDVANVEVRWADLTHAQVCQSLGRLMRDVVPLI